jgi:hypothetical protein
MTRSTDNTEIPLRTTMSGTVLAGANLDELDEVEELDEVDEIDELDEIAAFDDVTVCTTELVGAAAETLRPKTFPATAKKPTNHTTRTRRTPRRYSFAAPGPVQADSKMPRKSRLEAAAGYFGQDGAKIEACRIPQRLQIPSHRLSRCLRKSSAKSKSEF